MQFLGIKNHIIIVILKRTIQGGDNIQILVGGTTNISKSHHKQNHYPPYWPPHKPSLEDTLNWFM